VTYPNDLREMSNGHFSGHSGHSGHTPIDHIKRLYRESGLDLDSWSDASIFRLLYTSEYIVNAIKETLPSDRTGRFDQSGHGMTHSAHFAHSAHSENKRKPSTGGRSKKKVTGKKVTGKNVTGKKVTKKDVVKVAKVVKTAKVAKTNAKKPLHGPRSPPPQSRTIKSLPKIVPRKVLSTTVPNDRKPRTTGTTGTTGTNVGTTGGTIGNIGTIGKKYDNGKLYQGKNLEADLPKRIVNTVEIREAVRKVYGHVCSNNPSADDMMALVKCYDRVVFDGELLQGVVRQGCTFHVDCKLGGQACAGMLATYPTRRQHVLSVNLSVFNQCFRDGDRSHSINGLIVKSRGEALMVTVEHELIHLLMQVNGWTNKIKSGKGKNYYTCHGTLFRELAYRYFGHTDFRHHLHGGEITEVITKADCKIGQTVTFAFKGSDQSGTIIKVNPRRAKVRIHNGVIAVPYGIIKSVA